MITVTLHELPANRVDLSWVNEDATNPYTPPEELRRVRLMLLTALMGLEEE